MSLSLLLWGAGATGALLEILRSDHSAQSHVDLQMLNRVVAQSCRQGSWAHAAELLQAAAPIPYCLAMHEVVEVGAALQERRDHEHVGPRLALLFAASYARHSSAGAWGLLYRLGLPLLAVAGGGALREPFRLRWLLVMVVAGLVLFVHTTVRDSRRERRTREAAAELLPQLTEAVKREAAPAARVRPGPTIVRALCGDKLLGEAKLAGRDVKIGRISSADLQIEDPEVSRLHAVIERDPAGVLRIFDLGSEGGTWVNGEKITATRLRLDDRIELGARRCIRLVLVSDPGPEPGRRLEPGDAEPPATEY